MNVVTSIGLAGWAFRTVVASAFRAKLWIPFGVLGLVQLASLALLVSFYEPAVSWLTVPLIRWVGGETATHYPYFYAVLPAVFARWSLVVGVLLASLTTGAATVAFAHRFGAGEGRAWRSAGRRYPALVSVGLLGAAIGYLLYLAGSSIPNEVLWSSRAIRWGARLGSLAFFVLGQCFIVYATAAIVIEGRGLLAALRQAAGLFLALSLATLVVVGVPVFLNYPLDYLGERSDWFLGKFSPELMAGLLAVKILWEMVLSFLLVGAVTRLFVWRRGLE